MDDIQPAATYKPKLGDHGFFHPGNGEAPQTAEVVHVWSDTCVNLKTESGAAPTSVQVPGVSEAVSGPYFVPALILSIKPITTDDAGEPLPPPPWTQEQRDQFVYVTEVRRYENSIAQTAAIDRQTTALNEARAASQANVAVVQGAQTAAMQPLTDSEMVWDLIQRQFISDPVGPNGCVRDKMGVNNIVTWASQAVTKFREIHPESAPPRMP